MSEVGVRADSDADANPSPSRDVGEWTLDQIRSHVDADPDGVQNARGSVWTSRTRILGDARKSSTPFDRATVASVLDDLVEAERVLSWGGLLAPADPEHLLAVIETEQQASISRGLLKEQAARLRAKKRQQDGGSSDE